MKVDSVRLGQGLKWSELPHPANVKGIGRIHSG